MVTEAFHIGRIPTRRDKAEGTALFGFGDIEQREAVVVGVGDGQCLAVGRYSQSIGRTTRQCTLERSRIQGLLHFTVFQVDDRHRIIVGIGYEQPFTFLVETHLIGMAAHRNILFPLLMIDVPDSHAPTAPAGDIDQLLILRKKHVVTFSAQRLLANEMMVGEIIDVKTVVITCRDKKLPVFSGKGDARRRNLHGPGLIHHDTIRLRQLADSTDRIDANLVFITTGDVQPFVVWRKAETVPAHRDGDIGGHHLAFGIEKLYTLTTVAVIGHGQPFLVGRDCHVQRKIAQWKLLSRGCKFPAIGKCHRLRRL